jgi:hypothetical protein
MSLTYWVKFEPNFFMLKFYTNYGTFTLDVKSMLNENLGGILGDTHCWMGDNLMLSEC